MICFCLKGGAWLQPRKTFSTTFCIQDGQGPNQPTTTTTPAAAATAAGAATAAATHEHIHAFRKDGQSHNQGKSCCAIAVLQPRHTCEHSKHNQIFRYKLKTSSLNGIQQYRGSCTYIYIYTYTSNMQATIIYKLVCIIISEIIYIYI